MSRRIRVEYVWFAIRVAVGVIFCYAAFYKIVQPGAFAQQIYNYRLLPWWAVNPLAITLPWLQMFCGLLLIFNRWADGAGALVVLMMIVFQAALASALIRGLNVSCGCFKSGGSPATWMTFGRDFAIFLLALASWLRTLGARTRSSGGLWMADR